MTAVSHTEESSAAAASAAMSNSTDARYTKEADNPASVSAHTTSHTNESPGESRDVVKGVNTAWISVYCTIFSIALFNLVSIFLPFLFYSPKAPPKYKFFTAVHGWVPLYFVKHIKYMLLYVTSRRDWQNAIAIKIGTLDHNTCHLAYHYNVIVLFVAMLTLLLFFCGPRRYFPFRWMAIPIVASQATVLHAMAVMLASRWYSNFLGRKFAFPVLDLLVLVAQTCACVGIFCNGTKAASYLLPFYYLNKTH